MSRDLYIYLCNSHTHTLESWPPPTSSLTHSLLTREEDWWAGWVVGWLVGGSYGAFRLFVIYSHVSSQTASNLTTITTTKTAAAKQRTPIKTNKQESNNRQIN